MGRIDPKIVVKGEESTQKVVKFKGTTTFSEGHAHVFEVYEDDTIQIFETPYTNNATGQEEKHTHEYLGEYPYGVVSKAMKDSNSVKSHSHKINSVSHPLKVQKTIF